MLYAGLAVRQNGWSLHPQRGSAMAAGRAESSPNKNIERLQPGPRMSGAVVHGNTIYVAGQVSQNAPGKSVTEQTRDILSIIDGLLAQAGSDKTKLLSANIWLTDIATFNEMNAVWDAWVAPGNTPARATVEAKLAAPQFNVEIMVVAAR
jgi:enamine deaminase RidA (YjgF/YER057c/UK114 family)